jgi:uncharacterized protein (DUF433 family)
MHAKNLVSTDIERMSGTPCFVNTRVPIKTLFDYLEQGSPLAEFLDDFPSVSEDMAVALLESARVQVCHALAA